MTDDDVNKVVRDTLRRTLGSDVFADSRVRSGTDHDGDPVLFITVIFTAGQDVIDPTASLRVVREALVARGESRFPHMAYLYPDDPIALDDNEAA